jgi:hypothetical protein
VCAGMVSIGTSMSSRSEPGAGFQGSCRPNRAWSGAMGGRPGPGRGDSGGCWARVLGTRMTSSTPNLGNDAGSIHRLNPFEPHHNTCPCPVCLFDVSSMHPASNKVTRHSFCMSHSMRECGAAVVSRAKNSAPCGERFLLNF